MPHHTVARLAHVGTRFPYNTWLALGVFYPPRIDQTALPWCSSPPAGATMV